MRALDFSREHALLPIILHRYSLPQDGHRRIEFRLKKLELARLCKTHPTKLGRRELMIALGNLQYEVRRQLRMSTLPDRKNLGAALTAVWRTIQNAERARGAGLPTGARAI
jgi:hypothetical protein